MNWNRLSWVWFLITILISIIVFVNGITIELLFFIQILILIGILIDKLGDRTMVENIDKTQSKIYDFWLRTRDIKPDIRIRKTLLDKL